jgi:hypothetical protein
MSAETKVFDFVVNRRVIDDARKQGMTLSAFLETLDPTDRYSPSEPESQMDAFQRQLARYDIRTASNPYTGQLAHTWGRFFESDELGTKEERAALAAEWLSRQYRINSVRNLSNVQWAGKFNRGSGFVDAGVRAPNDAPLGYVLFPPATAPELRYQQLQPSALPFLIARTRYENAQNFFGLYLDDTQAEANARLSRTSEYASLRRFRFDTSEKSVSVKKYGGLLEMSYEQMRRMSLDMVSWAIMYIAAKADNDKEATAIDVLVNGDGNSGSAATSTSGSTLDGAASGALTLKMYLMWTMLWKRPYSVNTIVGRDAALVDLLLLNAGSANIAPVMLLGQNAPGVTRINLVRNTTDGVAAIDSDQVAANTLLGINRETALEMIMETGSEIVETDRVIDGQYTQIAFSENLAFMMATLGQNRTLAFTV